MSIAAAAKITETSISAIFPPTTSVMAPCLRGMVSRAKIVQHIAPCFPYHPRHLPRASSTVSSRSLFSPPKAFFPGHSLGIRQLRNFTSTTQPCTDSIEPAASALPLCCPGCGAYSQTIDPNELGYYSENRRRKLGTTTEKQHEVQQVPEGDGNENAQNGEEKVDLKAEGEAAAETIEKTLRGSEEKEEKISKRKRM